MSKKEGNDVPGRKPPIPEGWEYDSPWDNVVIPGDGEVSDLPVIPTVVKGVNDFSNYLMDQGSWTNPLTWPGVLAGAIGDGISDAPNKFLQGEDVNMADATLFGMEFIPGVGLAKKGVQRTAGHLALPQDITRRNHAYEAKDAVRPWYAAKKRPDGKSENPVIRKVQGALDSPMANRFAHLGKMMNQGLVKQPLRRLWDTEADALYRKHGISDSQKKEFERAFNWDDATRANHRANQNEIISNAQYIESILQKYFPNNTAFADDFKKVLFPKTVQTHGSSMMESALPVRKILGTGFASNEDVLTHISRPIVGALELQGKKVILNSKHWNEPNQMDRIFRSMGRSPSAQVLNVIKGMPEGMPLTYDNIVSQIAKRNDRITADLIKLEEPLMKGMKLKNGKISPRWKKSFSGKLERARKSYLSKYDNQRIRTSDLLDGMQETDRFISFGGRSLGEDRLLGNYNHRLILDKDTGEIFILKYDEMRQGTHSATMDWIMNAGTPETVAIDIIPFTRNAKGGYKQGDSVAKNMTQAEQAQEVRKGMEKMMGYESTLGDRAKTAAKAGGILTAGGHVGGYITEED